MNRIFLEDCGIISCAAANPSSVDIAYVHLAISVALIIVFVTSIVFLILAIAQRIKNRKTVMIISSVLTLAALLTLIIYNL